MLGCKKINLLGKATCLLPRICGTVLLTAVSGSGFTCCLFYSHSSLSGYRSASPCPGSVWALLSSWQHARLWGIYHFSRCGAGGSFWHCITSDASALQDTADLCPSVYHPPRNATFWRHTSKWDKLSLHTPWIFSPFLSLFPFMQQLHESNK